MTLIFLELIFILTSISLLLKFNIKKQLLGIFIPPQNQKFKYTPSIHCTKTYKNANLHADPQLLSSLAFLHRRARVHNSIPEALLLRHSAEQILAHTGAWTWTLHLPLASMPPCRIHPKKHLPSRDMPTARHFCSRQCWQRLRLVRSIRQFFWRGQE